MHLNFFACVAFIANLLAKLCDFNKIILKLPVVEVNKMYMSIIFSKIVPWGFIFYQLVNPCAGIFSTWKHKYAISSSFQRS